MNFYILFNQKVVNEKEYNGEKVTHIYVEPEIFEMKNGSYLIIDELNDQWEVIDKNNYSIEVSHDFEELNQIIKEEGVL